MEDDDRAGGTVIVMQMLRTWVGAVTSDTGPAVSLLCRGGLQADRKEPDLGIRVAVARRLAAGCARVSGVAWAELL
jgi:hypothetical protein